MKRLLNVTKALSDGNRLRVLGILRNGELCVCQITELLQLAPSTVSKHLTILTQAELIEGRKEGRWMHYRLADAGDALLRNTFKWLESVLPEVPSIKEDAQILKGILRVQPEVLSERQRCCAGKDSKKGKK